MNYANFLHFYERIFSKKLHFYERMFSENHIFMNEYLAENYTFMNECLAGNYTFMNVLGTLVGLGIPIKEALRGFCNKIVTRLKQLT